MFLEGRPAASEVDVGSSERRRFGKTALFGAMALAGWQWPSAGLASTRVNAIPTDLRSSNERMISYRHQQHLWLTSDGAMHLLFNRGTLTPAPGLAIYSSVDGGSTWLLTQALPATDDKSTGDVLPQGDNVAFVYHAADFSLQFRQMRWDAGSRSWTPLMSEVAYVSSEFTALNPTLAVDELGSWWVGFVSRRRSNGSVNMRIVSRPGGGTGWVDPNLVFGPTDNRGVERSARVVSFPGGAGMVWTVRETTFWSTRQVGQPPDAPWTTSTLFTGAVTKPLEDPYASHFNVTTDAQGGLHFITIENFDVLYFSLNADRTTWRGPIQVDDTRKVTYAQMGLANGKLFVAFTVQRGPGTMASSPDGGTQWAAAYELNRLPAAPGVNYGTARIEVPNQVTGTLPVLQQYADNGVQRLMLYRLPPI